MLAITACLRRLPAVALAVLLLLPASRGDAATLYGSTATIATTGSAFVATPGTAVIGAGAEFTTSLLSVDQALSIDIGESSVTLRNIGGGNFFLATVRTLTLSGLDFTGPASPITGIDVAFSGTISAFSASSFAFTANSLSLTIGAGSILDNATAVVTFRTATVNAVPEPASLGLLACGLVGVGLMRRRRRA